MVSSVTKKTLIATQAEAGLEKLRTAIERNDTRRSMSRVVSITEHFFEMIGGDHAIAELMSDTFSLAKENKSVDVRTRFLNACHKWASDYDAVNNEQLQLGDLSQEELRAMMFNEVVGMLQNDDELAAGLLATVLHDKSEEEKSELLRLAFGGDHLE